MKRKICLLFTFVVMICLVACVSINVSAADLVTEGQCGENAYWSFDENTGTLTISGMGKIDDVVLFDEETGEMLIDENTGDPVWNMPWYHLKNQIHTIVIEEGITEIGALAFYSFYYLTEVDFPSTLEVVGCAAFCDCIRLEELDFPDSVKTLYVSNYNEIAIKKIVLPASLETTPTIPGIDEIFDFNMCAYLESITIPEEIGTIEVTVDGSNPSIRNIYNYSTEALIKFDERNDMWYGDEATAEYMTVTIGAALASIEYEMTDEEREAFVLEKIKEYYGEDYAEKVPYPNLIDTVPDYIKVYCYENSAQHLYCVENNINFVLIDSHSHLNSDNDGNCDICGEIFIVDSGNCGANGDNVTWTFYSDGKLVISGTGAMADNFFEFSKLDIKNVIIESGITTIGGWALARCDELVSIEIPDAVTSIGDSAFSGCESLTAVTIPASVTTIGKAAFFNCKSLESVTIPAGITSISELSFCGCKNLTSVSIKKNVTSVGKTAFDGCTSLADVYYDGTAQEWAKITIKSGNDPLINATKNFGAVCRHTEDGHETETFEEIIDEPTFFDDGSYEEITKCKNCGEELSREIKTIPDISLMETIADEIEEFFKGPISAIANVLKRILKIFGKK